MNVEERRKIREDIEHILVRLEHLKDVLGELKEKRTPLQEKLLERELNRLGIGSSCYDYGDECCLSPIGIECVLKYLLEFEVTDIDSIKKER